VLVCPRTWNEPPGTIAGCPMCSNMHSHVTSVATADVQAALADCTEELQYEYQSAGPHIERARVSIDLKDYQVRTHGLCNNQLIN